jgi:hypothetical protein
MPNYNKRPKPPSPPPKLKGKEQPKLITFLGIVLFLYSLWVVLNIV